MCIRVFGFVGRGSILVLVRILHVVEEAVFGADEEVGDAVFIPVDGGGAGGVTCEKAGVDFAHVFQDELSVFCSGVFVEVGIAAV